MTDVPKDRIESAVALLRRQKRHEVADMLAEDYL